MHRRVSDSDAVGRGAGGIDAGGFLRHASRGLRGDVDATHHWRIVLRQIKDANVLGGGAGALQLGAPLDVARVGAADDGVLRIGERLGPIAPGFVGPRGVSGARCEAGLPVVSPGEAAPARDASGIVHGRFVACRSRLPNRPRGRACPYRRWRRRVRWNREASAWPRLRWSRPAAWLCDPTPGGTRGLARRWRTPASRSARPACCRRFLLSNSTAFRRSSRD